MFYCGFNVSDDLFLRLTVVLHAVTFCFHKKLQNLKKKNQQAALVYLGNNFYIFMFWRIFLLLLGKTLISFLVKYVMSLEAFTALCNDESPLTAKLMLGPLNYLIVLVKGIVH